MSYQAPTPTIIWVNLIFFITTALLGFVGGPIYVAYFGLSGFEAALTLFYIAATGISITAGYHRLFSHVTYQAHPVIQFLFLFFGAAAFEQSALDWSAQHRDHHRYVDTDRDPYSIKKGFFYAHVGWLVFWRHHIPYDVVTDLSKNPLVQHQHRHYHLWAIVSGIIVPVLIGAAAGHALGAFLLAFCFRVAFVHHATFCINSVCHTFGKSTYDIHATARDHWFVAYLTNGEGYHNFHHRFPSDYRNGIRWYQWDPSKWLIKALSFVGLTRNLKKVSSFRIWEARLAAENLRIREKMADPRAAFEAEDLGIRLQEQYKRLGLILRSWETQSREYQALLADRLAPSRELLEKGVAKMKEARRSFVAERHRWIRLIRSDARLANVS